MRAIAELGKCTQHPNWAGSTAFTQNPISRLFVDSFRSVTRQQASTNLMHTSVEDALVFLESLKPGLTANIDWDGILAENKMRS